MKKNRFLRLAMAVFTPVPVVFFGFWLLDSTRITKSRYRKYEYRIPMRDGVTLFTQVYVPRDRTKSYPFLMQRTPFGVSPYGGTKYRPHLGASSKFDEAGYIFVFQDVRGRYQSGSDFIDMRPHIDRPLPAQTDESTDTFDTVEWLLKNVTGHNGKVGIWGMSYPGFYATASIIDTHPAIKAASIQAPMTNLFLGDDAYHNGVFMLAAQFGLYATYFKSRSTATDFPPSNFEPFKYGTSDGSQFFLNRGPSLSELAPLANNAFLNTNIEHATYDEYWQARDISAHLHHIHCAVMTVGGWYDAEDLAGTFRTYQAMKVANPDSTNLLIMGPWAHGDWLRSAGRKLGSLDFGSDTAVYFRDQALFTFFEHHLKGAPAPDLPGALTFETGTNLWQRYASWPPPEAQPESLYLRGGGKLSFEPPDRQETPYDEYLSDPAKPVPYLEHPPAEVASEYMYGDQRFASARPDVLTYRSEPLQEDLTVAGPIKVRLQVSSSGTDSDFDVLLIDQDSSTSSSSGAEQLVRGEPMRARFRKSFTKPEALKPNEVTPVGYAMPAVNHTFRTGHRIVIRIQSSWFPLTDLNPQQFMQISTAKRDDFVQATQRVFHQPLAASLVILPMVKKRQALKAP